MPETVLKPHTLRYRDFDNAQREMPDPQFRWHGTRGTLTAIATTKDGAVAMLDRMEAARAS
jgi:hypothetical protein